MIRSNEVVFKKKNKKQQNEKKQKKNPKNPVFRANT